MRMETMKLRPELHAAFEELLEAGDALSGIVYSRSVQVQPPGEAKFYKESCEKWERAVRKLRMAIGTHEVKGSISDHPHQAAKRS